jgi:hypothetical protein
MPLNLHLDLHANGVNLLRSLWALVASSCSLLRPVRAAGVARLFTPCAWLPAGLGAVAHSPSSLMLQQVSCMFSRLVLLRAPLALRLLSCSSPGVLPVNKAFQGT